MNKYKKVSKDKIEHLFIPYDGTIRQAMKAIGQGKLGTVIIVEAESKSFLGLVTDGDIRRALLSGYGLETSLEFVDRPKPKTATVNMTIAEIADIFTEKIRVVPILDSNNNIVDVAFYDKRLHLPISEPSLSGKELEYVTDCITSNWISSAGNYVQQFESNFADYCEVKYAISVCNGTAALHLSMLALDIGPNNEVIMPDLTFIATANAVSYTGAKPVFVDIDRKTWNIDPYQIEASITDKTKAIIPVHLYGHPVDIDPIMKIAEKYNLYVVEDAAEAHGAEYKQKKVGSFGDMGIFSFYGNKIITTGEGGMITTNSKETANRLKILRDHGMSSSKRYWHPVLGYNYRLTNIQAAVGVAQLEKIDNILFSKRKIAERYIKRLFGIKGITLPPNEVWAKNVYWLFSIIIEDDFNITRDELIDHLSKHGIETRPFFPSLHTQPIYKTDNNYPVSCAISEKGISLPSFVSINRYEIDKTCDIIIKTAL